MGKPTELEQITTMMNQVNEMREKQESLLYADIHNHGLNEQERFTLRQERMDYDREMIRFLKSCVEQLKKMKSETAAIQVPLFEGLVTIVKSKLETAKAKS